MSETLVTRMARAMFPTFWWEEGEERDRIAARDKALAALREIREPTKAMCMPGLDAIDEYAENYDLKVVADFRSIMCWQAMVDAAIAEAGGQE